MNDIVSFNSKTVTHLGSEAAGWAKDPEYYAWNSILQRCLNKDHPSYKYYGGRGITVCDRWKSSFRCFLQDVGLRPVQSYSIDRRDNDGNYEPGNVRWASKLMQVHNRN